MSIKDYIPPFQTKSTSEEGSWMVCDSMSFMLFDGVSHKVGVEISSILNAHFAPKKAESDPGGICDKCLSIHGPAYIGRKCISSKDCGGTVQDIAQPQPNREETDRVAMEFYKSGRTITVEHWCNDSKRWNWSGGQPGFFPDLAYRIKPAKRRVVVEIYKTLDGSLISRIKDGPPLGRTFTLLGTIEGEVEA